MGLDVLSEKPVGFDPVAIERLGERAAAAGRVLAVGFWRRTAWPYVEARRLVAEGAIGTPTFLRSSQWDADLPPLAFADPEVSGGVEVDCGVHEADLARWFLGCEIAQVSATGTPGALAEVGDAETCRGPGRHHRRPGRRDRPGPNLRLRRRRPHRDPGTRRRAPDRRSRPRWAAPRRPVRPARRPRPRRRRPRAGARRSARTVCRGMPGCGAARDGDRRRPRARGRAGDAPLAPGGRRNRDAHEHCHVSLRRSVRTARCSWCAVPATNPCRREGPYLVPPRPRIGRMRRARRRPHHGTTAGRAGECADFVTMVSQRHRRHLLRRTPRRHRTCTGQPRSPMRAQARGSVGLTYGLTSSRARR